MNGMEGVVRAVRRAKSKSAILIIFMIIIIISGCVDKNNKKYYPLHINITATIFWIGEEESEENHFIANSQSAWDDDWKAHYGGYDHPYDRVGFNPNSFTPKENPFYFALPYNDFDKNGNKKLDADSSICDPICKNVWIKIIKGNRIAYAQWEDVGPFEENDSGYVFGGDKPKNTINNNAGLDVSPAVRDYLKLDDIDKVDWQFVGVKDIPNGPWKKLVTHSQIYWND